MANLSAFGERGFSGTFGFENNEIHRKIWLQDAENQLVPLLQKLFGDGSGSDFYDVHQFPSPFDGGGGSPGDSEGTGFFAHSVSFDTSSDKGAQGDTSDDGDFSLLDQFPQIRGGVVVDITYRPMDQTQNLNVDDESWDFSAQVMSLVGNSFGQNPQQLSWGPDNTPITNLQSIIKIIPKIEFRQRRIWAMNAPGEQVRQLIGSVNAAAFNLGSAGGNSGNDLFSWPEACVLLVGMPTVRRWRFDGLSVFETTLQFAINVYQDICDNTPNSGGGSFKAEYVTWNRLYRPESGSWNYVQIGPGTVNGVPSTPMYPEADFGQLLAAF